MILKKLRLWNFRKFYSDGEKPGIEIEFHEGINALIGENDSGKSAIIDAIKMILQTRSNEFIRVIDEDFYCNEAGEFKNEFKIECEFSEFTDGEAKNFIEWLQFKKDENEHINYFLSINFRAWKENKKIFNEFRAGANEEGSRMDGKAREFLKCTYLRPLRDAAREMHSGRNSRISQILYNHSIFKSGEEHELVQILKIANEQIGQYFTSDGGEEVLSALKNNLDEFLEASTGEKPKFVTSDLRLKSILESLSLNMSEIQPGLGAQNLLFMAAELLLLKHNDDGSLKLALIEEIEAHLHPQAQLRLIDYIQKEYDNAGVQFILSTHSTILASKVNIKNVLFCKNSKVFSLAPEKTELLKGDYLFLQRFLNSSRANLFFAQGVIMVEGDAENLLIPVLAEIIGLPLSKYGVSIVNVGTTAFLRYSKIFRQKSEETMGIRVSIITDADVRPKFTNDSIDVDKLQAETEKAIKDKEMLYSKGEIKTFVAPFWTLEYTLALSFLHKELYSAILYADKIQNSDKYALTNEKIVEVDKKVESDFDDWNRKGLSEYEIAYIIYHGVLLKGENNNLKNVSKAVTAQCLASILKYATLEDSKITKELMFDIDLYQEKVSVEKKQELKEKIENDENLRYLIYAIRYAAGQ